MVMKLEFVDIYKKAREADIRSSTLLSHARKALWCPIARPGLVDFAIRLVNSVINMADG